VLNIYLSNFDNIPSFVVKACLLALSKLYLNKIFEVAENRIDLFNDSLSPEVLACFNYGSNVRVRIRNFTDFHEAFNCMNDYSLLHMALLHSTKELIMCLF